ncbi:MAG: cysteine rich repeat-containing protein [Methylocystis sp.]|uniref:cysteine rich repeat-containing protein n=1 Tax=Methylocystis sp. TaxID=1911079 RepID=UPI003DA69871
MRRMFLALPILTLLAPPAFAQGTPEQRQACKDDAYKFCPYDVPDPDKVEACLRKYIRSISAACRAQFGK